MDLNEQQRSGFRYGYSVYQAQYSRNLMFTVGAQMEKVFDRVVDRTRSRLRALDVEGLHQEPGPAALGRRGGGKIWAASADVDHVATCGSSVIFGPGEHVLRLEAITHNTKQLRCGRVLDRFPEIIGKLAGMVDRFATT